MFLSTILARISTWLKHRDGMRSLSALTDRELHDIGLSRHEIRAAAAGRLR